MSFSDNFSTDTGAWTYLGSAYRDQTNQYVVILTNTNFGQGGAIFFKNPVEGTFTATFSYKMGGGQGGADGITMFFYKQYYTSIDNGGSLGFSSPGAIVPGYGIEFDSWQNIASDFQNMAGGHPGAQGDPSGHHIALIEDYAGNHLAVANYDKVADNNWHQVIVNVQQSSVDVYVDGALILTWSGAFTQTYSGFGFSGATGDDSDWHVIDNVSITQPAQIQPFALPEYAFGAAAATLSCFAALVLYKKRAR